MARYPTRFQQRTLWNAATGTAMLVLGALVVGAIWMTGQVLGFLNPVVLPLAVAGIIAYLLDPVVRWIQQRGMSRGRAVIMVFAGSTLLTAILVAVMIPLVGHQINEFRDKRAAEQEALRQDNGEAAPPPTPEAADQPRAPFDERVVSVLLAERLESPWARPLIDSALSAPEEMILREARIVGMADNGNLAYPMLRGEALTEALNEAEASDEVPYPDIRLERTQLWTTLKGFQDEAINWARGGTSKILGMIGMIIGFLMVPIYLYFFLRESAAIKQHWHDYVPLKASRFKTEVIETLTEINQYLISFFRGQVLVAFIDGILVGIALTIFGLPLGLLIGLMVAVLGIIPFIGNIITLIPACLLAYFHFSDPAEQGMLGHNPWSYVVAVIAIFVIVQQINSLVTAPKIVGDSVGLHPMTVIFSMLFWSLLLGGFVGALLAVPLTASVKVLFRRYIWERQLKEGPRLDDDPDEWSPAET